MTGGLIAQIGFGSLFMLTWMAAGMIPIVLYLLRKRSRSTVPWAAMRLLRQVILQESRRSSLQQWLLLVTRIAIMLILALALARPFWGDLASTSSLAESRSSRLIIFVLDTSYSMGYRSDQTTRLEMAKERIRELVRESQLGDAFGLVVLDRPARSIIRRPTFASNALLDEVRQLNDSALDCDLESGLAIVNEIVADARQDQGMPKQIDVVILSDLGADAWSTDPASPVGVLLGQLDEISNVTVESFASSDPMNTAILSVTPSTKRALVGQPIRFDVKLAAVGGSVQTIPVRLEQDGRTVATLDTELGPDQTIDVQLQTVSRQPGKRLFSIVIPPDNLPIDNRWDLVVEVQNEIRILIVDSESRGVNAWKLALNPPGATVRPDGSEVMRVVTESEWLSLRLQEWDVIVLNDPTMTVPGQLNRLRNYVQSGGLAVLALGPKLWSDASPRTRDNLGQLLGLELAEPSQWGDWVLDPLQYASPIINVFEGFPGAGLLTTPIYRYWQAEVRSDAVVTDIGLSGGAPLLVRSSVGSGVIACLLTAAQDGRGSGESRSWSAMTSWPSFLPLAQQLIQTLVSTRVGEYNRVAGQELAGTVESPEVVVEVILQRPDQSKSSILAEPRDASGRSIWRYSRTDQRGVYRIVAPEDRQQLFAVNIDSKQSRLESIDLSDLPIRQDRVPLDASHPLPLDSDVNSRALPLPEYGSRLLLLLLGTLLIGESLLACFMGRSVG